MTKIRLSATFDIEENDVPPGHLCEMQYGIIDRAVHDGMITGDMDACLSLYTTWVEIVPDAIPIPEQPSIERLDEMVWEMVEDHPWEWTYGEVALELMQRNPALAAETLGWALKYHVPALDISPRSEEEEDA